MKSIDQIDLHGKRVFIRVDFNVPLDGKGRITDDNRIRMALPTIRYALEQGAAVVLASHAGRPKGKRNPAFSLKPVAERLGELLDRPVVLAPDCVGSETQAMKTKLEPGGLLLLENLRFHPGETQNDADFARTLADGCDVYINDAFGVSHRAHASVSAIAAFFEEKGAGFLLRKEMDTFHTFAQNPERPLTAIVGGAKVSDKLGALRNLLRLVDRMIIGGAMANTFLAAMGFNTGTSLVEHELVDTARELMEEFRGLRKPLYLPVDGITARELSENVPTRVSTAQEIPPDQMVLDIGPATILLFTEALSGSRTILWNGPMGAFEKEAFSKGTYALVDAVADSGAFSIIGGGDTGLAIHRSGKEDQISFISTGGGAFLALLEGKTLPGIAALES